MVFSNNKNSVRVELPAFSEHLTGGLVRRFKFNWAETVSESLPERDLRDCPMSSCGVVRFRLHESGCDA